MIELSTSRIGTTGRSKWLAVVVAAVVAIGGAGYLVNSLGGSTGATATPAAGHVFGVVVGEGGPPPVSGAHNQIPVSNPRIVVTGRTASGQPFNRGFQADATGHFRLQLPAGRYRLTVPVSADASPALQPHTLVTVRPGHPAAARIVIQMN